MSAARPSSPHCRISTPPAAQKLSSAAQARQTSTAHSLRKSLNSQAPSSFSLIHCFTLSLLVPSFPWPLVPCFFIASSIAFAARRSRAFGRLIIKDAHQMPLPLRGRQRLPRPCAPRAAAGTAAAAPAADLPRPPSPASAARPTSPRASAGSRRSSVHRPTSQSRAACSRSAHQTTASICGRNSAPAPVLPAAESRALPDPAPATRPPCRQRARRAPACIFLFTSRTAPSARIVETATCETRNPQSHRARAAPCAPATPSPNQTEPAQSPTAAPSHPAPAPP